MRLKAYPKYKESGIEWLGELPEGWEVTKVKYVANFTVSNVDKKYQEGETPIRLFNYTDVYNNEFLTNDIDLMAASASLEQIRKFNAQNNDVLITKDSEDWRDIARPALVKSSAPDIVCGYHLAIIRPCIKQTVGKFIYRLLQSNLINQQFQIASNGVTRYGLPKSAIGDSLFTVPPLKEQQAIASFLDRETARIDALIQKKERMIELLKEKRIALITQAVTKGLDPNAKMKDSGIEWLGEVPEHWGIKRLKYLSTYNDESLPETTDPNYEMLYVDISSVSRIQGITQKDEMVFEDAPSRARRVVKDGDTIVSTVRTYLRAIASMINPEENLIVSTGFAVIRPGGISSGYLSLVLKSHYVIESIVSRSVGVSYPAINASEIGEIFILQPPESEQQEIVNGVHMETTQMNELQSKTEYSISLLREYRSSLIHSAVTGKIDLRDSYEEL
ncbi:restriction endonuclease subunit S [Candidatus Cloacimonadota bacterium]